VVQQTYLDVLQMAQQHAATSSPAQSEAVPILEETLREMQERAKRKDPAVEAQLAALRREINAGRMAEAAALEAGILGHMGIQLMERMLTLKHMEYDQGEKILLQARETLAAHYLRERQYAEAARILRQILEKPEDVGTSYRLANLVGQKADPTLVLRLFTAASLQAGQVKEALEVLAGLIERNPLDWRARDAAREFLQEHVRDYRRSLDQSLALASLLDPRKHVVLPGLLKVIPVTYAEATYHAGAAAEQIRRYDLALEQYQLAAASDPNGEYGKRATAGIGRVIPRLQESGRKPGAQ